MLKEIPQILKRLRLSGNFSQEFVASNLGISLSTYSRIERGQVQIDLVTAHKVSLFYKISLDELVNGPLVESNAKRLSEQSSSIVMLVELDGKKETLDRWINRLKAINSVV